jgi:hypothetical protein
LSKSLELPAETEAETTVQEQEREFGFEYEGQRFWLHPWLNTSCKPNPSTLHRFVWLLSEVMRQIEKIHPNRRGPEGKNLRLIFEKQMEGTKSDLAPEKRPPRLIV